MKTLNIQFLIQFLFISIVNPRICNEFRTIQETALKIPETTEDITEMLAYIGHVKTKGIEELNAKIMVRVILQNLPVVSQACTMHLWGLNDGQRAEQRAKAVPQELKLSCGVWNIALTHPYLSLGSCSWI